jgi:hypothetical protein
VENNAPPPDVKSATPRLARAGVSWIFLPFTWVKAIRKAGVSS